jgi:hypothetical protein
MKRSAALVAAAAATLVPAAPALAAYTPKLTVNGRSQALAAPGGVTIRYAQGGTEEAAARLTTYVPAGYTLALGQEAGTTIGSVAATVAARALGGNILPLAGAVVVRSPSGTYLANGVPAPIATAATACTGTVSHAAVWVLVLGATSQTLEVPVFVDVSAEDPVQAAYTLTLCLPSPHVPPPVGAALGAKLLTLTFSVDPLTNPATRGSYRWSSVATPYVAGTATVDSAGGVEIQSLVTLPSRAVLQASAKRLPKARAYARVSYRAAVTSAGKGAPARLLILRGSSPRGVGKLVSRRSAKGPLSAGFTVKLLRRPSALYLLARATVPDRDLGEAGCIATFTEPPLQLPCIDATAGGFAVVSNVVKIALAGRR